MRMKSGVFSNKFESHSLRAYAETRYNTLVFALMRAMLSSCAMWQGPLHSMPTPIKRPADEPAP
jgi:hypothetical protein